MEYSEKKAEVNKRQLYQAAVRAEIAKLLEANVPESDERLKQLRHLLMENRRGPLGLRALNNFFSPYNVNKK